MQDLIFFLALVAAICAPIVIEQARFNREQRKK